MNRCKTCKHAKPVHENSSYPPEFLECEGISTEWTDMGHDYYRMYKAFVTDGELTVSPDFGCALWEAKDAVQRQT